MTMIDSAQLRLLTVVPAVLLGAAAVVVVVWLAAHLVRYLLADAEIRRALRVGWRIRWTRRRTAVRVGLVQTERIRPPLWSSRPQTVVVRRELVPSVRVRARRWGVEVDVATVGRLGLVEFQDAAGHLADAWRVPQVRVAQVRPGLVRLRALLVDPLTQPTVWDGQAATVDYLETWSAGVDADGQPVTIRSSGVSGVVVAGLAGFGKTSLLNARFCQLAPSSAVQFVLIDGKGGPDYDDLFRRAWLSAKDDPEQVRDHLARVHELMTGRQRCIRAVLGVKNVWHLGPSASWPLVVVVIDEAHTFFNESKGTDVESKKRDALARQTARLVEELVRKGRNVGIQVILATQKATGDAIPTKIRDNCQVAVSFAQRTSEAATAVLGSDITGFPDEHPRRLQDPAYIGVASMVAEGRPGFTLVRTPYVSDEAADRIAADTAHLVRDPLRLLADAARAERPGGQDREGGGSFRQEHSAALPASSPSTSGKELR
ncbi:FtsK/SpoIIIE domain-containing protein [Micromonospora olivasterospora]|uniref:S-DNA-T family DNA segregation ATPase FtsK/SpoIIIE n=1 Tax=Micromonospora olivasterospora TaxID=1880 RepID=A0A562I3H2_MICOL|nr:FtsK/SpoIIIE domain-containing protein [Micromonospora olivasterospora]TWH65258.1 S-DNA-T family DNA segregation ATPase FtsK/SpoIIIE [Micromonospora olivasterospora]